jgi:ABC-type glycerol-3-phosphate transport system substrate-binding protein
MTEKMNAAVAAGSVPDVAGIKDFRMKDYAWRGAVLSLDDYFDGGDYDTSEFRKSVWDAMHYQGKAYGAPWPGSFVHVLFINDDLFEGAGLSLENDIPTNWEELVEVAGKMTDPAKEQYGHSFYELSTREYMLMLLSVYMGQLGGKVFTEDGTKVTLDTPEGREAMQWMHDMLYEWKYALPVELMEGRWDLFYSGVIGSFNAGPWSIWSIRTNAPQINFSIHQWPCAKTCDNVDAPECLIVLKDASDPDLSWEGIKVLLNKEWDLELGAPRGALPVFDENLDKGAYAEDPPFVAYAKIGRGEGLRPRSWLEGYEEIASHITPEIQAVWFDQKSVAEGLAAAEKAGNEALARIKK